MNEQAEKTYRMEYTCSNCGNTYEKKIPFGCGAKAGGGECPYCGVFDHGSFGYQRPYSVRLANQMRNVWVD